MKKIFNIFLIIFLISFQLKSFAGEKNYHKELITDSQIKIEMPQVQNFLNTS